MTRFVRKLELTWTSGPIRNVVSWSGVEARNLGVAKC